MASQCPKCKQVVENDVICCAEIRQTWKCRACSKLTVGFVVPYGRCFMCGGQIEVVEGYAGQSAGKTRVIQEAFRYELEMYQFYKLGMQRTSNVSLKEIFEEMFAKEQDHLDELESKYHVHLEPDLRDPPPATADAMTGWLFEGIDFADDTHALAIYDKAIELEKRTRDHFSARADGLPEGPEKAIYQELAAEEEEHVALLETERAQLTGEG